MGQVSEFTPLATAGSTNRLAYELTRENILRLKLQANKDAEDKTLKDMTAKDSHLVYATLDINVTQDPTEENLEIFRKAISEKIFV